MAFEASLDWYGLRLLRLSGLATGYPQGEYSVFHCRMYVLRLAIHHNTSKISITLFLQRRSAHPGMWRNDQRPCKLAEFALPHAVPTFGKHRVRHPCNGELSHTAVWTYGKREAQVCLFDSRKLEHGCDHVICGIEMHIRAYGISGCWSCLRTAMGRGWCLPRSRCP